MASAEFWQAPAEALAPAREAARLARTTRGEPVVLRYAETEALLGDARMRTVGAQLLRSVGVESGPLAEWWRLVMFNTNPPAHGRLRNLVSRAFTARRVDALRPRVRALAEALLEPLLDAGAVDYEVELADPLPIRVTCALLGVPADAHAEVAGWTHTLGTAFTTRMTAEHRARCEMAVVSLAERLRALFAERERAPRDDLLTAMLAPDAGGDRLSPPEREAMAINLLFAGHDTTRGLLSIGLARMLAEPGALAALRAAPERVPGAVEEMLRLEPPVLGSLRAPAEAIALGAHRLEPGVPVHFLFAAGNRDPRVFDAPDRFDAARPGPRPLAFGLGPHFCLGAGLARVEAQEVLALLAARTRAIALEAAPRFVPFATIRRLDGGLRLRLSSG